MFPGIWFQRFEPVKFWGQTYSNGTPREQKLLLCLNQEAYQGILNDFLQLKVKRSDQSSPCYLLHSFQIKNKKKIPKTNKKPTLSSPPGRDSQVCSCHHPSNYWKDPTWLERSMQDCFTPAQIFCLLKQDLKE